MSAFFLYSQAYRSTAKEENPEASFGDIVSHGAAERFVGCVFGVFASCYAGYLVATWSGTKK